ncbi:hypothetical protein CcrColossus_gp226 [Caulobacter phage CcrColossus]|uniref:Uncharacterized protein n=1 Tax=Caulobacter phage CcrColossus TaxID=1211640 RepID=K4JSK6_9CAUD|nr:hypothetical protein CcrColossus_gp226 [Caulobacter phage CcrColossus]AFU88096.1 hypothetical protein CcrColossus_gp226 [Caulobacter phage CcrColossus]
MQPTDFPLIRAAISPRRAAQFDAALANVKAFTEEGVLIKAEWNDIKDTFSRAIDETWSAFKDAEYYPRARAGETEEVGKLYWGLLSPYPHVLASYLKKVQAAKNIEPAVLRDFPIAFFTEALPLNDMLVALKPLIGKRAPKKTKVQIEREGKERTCQVCGRGILAENGRIAHHGYQRPGMGYQTASCSGALHVPFEISRDALGDDIKNLERYRARRQAYRVEVETETVSLPINYEVSEQDPRRALGFKHVVKKMIHVTRDDFDAQKVTTPEAFAGKYGPRKPEGYGWMPFDFDALKTQILGSIDNEIDIITSTINRQQARYDGWKQTLVFVDGAYQAFTGEN